MAVDHCARPDGGLSTPTGTPDGTGSQEAADDSVPVVARGRCVHARRTDHRAPPPASGGRV